MPTLLHPASSHLPTPSGWLRRSRLPIDWRTLRGARLRAKELGVLQEFWELVSAGNFDGARERLAVAEQRDAERTRERRENLRYLLAVIATVCVTAVWLLALDGR